MLPWVTLKKCIAPSGLRKEKSIDTGSFGGIVKTTKLRFTPSQESQDLLDVLPDSPCVKLPTYLSSVISQKKGVCCIKMPMLMTF